MGQAIFKEVNDLGIAAYLMLHGYSTVGKKGKAIYFECPTESAADEFENLVLEFQPPNEFYLFDSCLMYLKKLNDFIPKSFPKTLDPELHQEVIDLGRAAYLLTMECVLPKEKRLNIKVMGKRGKYVYFKVPEGKREEFERACWKYTSSQFQTFDSNLMAVKKNDEYMPSRR